MIHPICATLMWPAAVSGAKRTFVERSTSKKWHRQTHTAAINSFTYRQHLRTNGSQHELTVEMEDG